MVVVPDGSLFQRWCTRKPANSDETKINFFGSDGVKRVWRQPGEEFKDKYVLPTVKHGGGIVMVWGCMSAAGTGVLQFIEGTVNANMYSDILKQSPALWEKLRVKVMDWPSMSPDLYPIDHLWGIAKQKEEEHKVSNIHQFCDAVMEEWKRIREATCEDLVNSLWGVLTFAASGSDINGCVLSYLEGTVDFCCYTSSTLTT